MAARNVPGSSNRAGPPPVLTVLHRGTDRDLDRGLAIVSTWTSMSDRTNHGKYNCQTLEPTT
jgi:hypothetical protein